MSRKGISETAFPPFALRDAEGVGKKPTEGSEAVPRQGPGDEGKQDVFSKRQYGILLQCILLMLALLSMPAMLTAQDEGECPAPPGATIPPVAWHIGQGDAHAARAQHALALIDYTCALAIAPDTAIAYARRAYAYAALGDDKAAMADFEQALALDEMLVETYINRGTLYARLGNFGLALGDFTLALGLDPQAVAAFNNRAVVHAIEGNLDLALADLEQAIALDPGDPAAYATLGAVYSALAARSYQQFVETGGEEARLPAGTPTQVLTAVDDSLRTGNYAIWLALLERGQ